MTGTRNGNWKLVQTQRTQSPILRYGIAFVAVAIALFLTLPISPLIKPTVFPLFFVAVMMSAWYGGLGPGLLATGLSVAAIDYFFIPAAGILADREALSRLALFVVAALLTSIVTSGWKWTDQALRESELRFRSVTQSATEAIIVADSHGNMIVWNRAAQNMFGYQEAEVMGKPVTLLMPARYRDAHSKGLERLRATGESKIIGKTVELHGLRKNGQEFPLELSVATWQTRQSTFFGGIIRDITPRKQAEEALRKAHAELETRVQERTAELSKANGGLQEEISAHHQAEEQKQKLLQDLHERVKELEVLHEMARLLQNEQKTGIELLREIAGILPPACQYPEVAAARVVFDGAECTTPNFSPTPWNLSAAFTTPSGKHGAVEIVYLEERPDKVEDPFVAEERSLINSLAEMLMLYLERKEAETRVAQVTRELVERNEELWRLQKEMGRVEPLAALGRVTGMIAHELGTPLNTVLGHSQLLSEEELTEAGHSRLRTIQEQIQRMVNIVQYYLSRTRGAKPARSQVNVNELVLETLALLKPVFEQHKLQVRTILAESLPPLSAHRASLQRVLINLLNNAIDALKEGGTVTIATSVGAGSLKTSKKGVVVEITDTGAGIPAETLPKVFDLFLTTKELGKGTGFGLAVCQEIVKSHGGAIEITSKLGEGTCVRVFLPIDDTAGQSASLEARESWRTF
jgi:PAS domain S-box-containing protein